MFFGHSQPGAFTERAERLMSGIAGQAAVALDNARLFQATQREIAERERAEERFRAVVDQASAGIVQTDLEGRFTAVNDLYREIVGRTRDELLDLRMQDITHPDDLIANLPLFRAAAAGGEQFDIEKRYVRPDGSHVWVRNSVNAIHGSDGKIEAVVAVAIDLTERRATEARFRNMADHAPVMMWVTDPNAYCTYLNRAWYEFTGQSEAEGQGLGWLEAVHPDDRGWSSEMFLAANAKRESFRLEYRLRRHDGQYRWAIDAASPRFGPDGEFLGYIGSVIDIDERREAEEALQKSYVELRSNAEELARFNRVAVERELRVIEIKKEVNELCDRLGLPRRYALEFEQPGLERQLYCMYLEPTVNPNR